MFICSETLSHQGPGSLPRSNCFCRWLVRCVPDPAVQWVGLGSCPTKCRLQVISTHHNGAQGQLSGARALFSRPVICLSGEQSLPRAPVISESPGSSQNVSEGGLKTLTIWWTSQAGAASSSHRATFGFDFLFIAPCLSSNIFICCCFPLTASSENPLLSKV